MTFGTSILLIAVGAILRFAVHVSASGLSIHTIGVILMIVGAVGGVLLGGPLGDVLLRRGRLSGRVVVAAVSSAVTVAVERAAEIVWARTRLS